MIDDEYECKLMNDYSGWLYETFLPGKELGVDQQFILV